MCISLTSWNFVSISASINALAVYPSSSTSNENEGSNGDETAWEKGLRQAREVGCHSCFICLNFLRKFLSSKNVYYLVDDKGIKKTRRRT